MVQTPSKWHKLLQNGTNCFKMVQIPPKWYKLLQNGTNCFKMSPLYTTEYSVHYINGQWLTLPPIETNTWDVCTTQQQHVCRGVGTLLVVPGNEGENKTIETIRQNHLWAKLSDDVQKYIKTCDICQRNKLTRIRPSEEAILTDTPTNLNDKIAMDIVGPLSLTNKGNQLILSIQEYLTSRTKTQSCIQWGSINGGEIEFESLTENTLEGALEVIWKSFFTNESICKVVNLISASCSARALMELCVEIARDGVSIVAVDVKTEEVVGVVLNKIKILRDHPVQRDPLTNPYGQKSWLERFNDNCIHHAARGYVDFLIAIHSKINLFKYYNIDCIMECMFLATLPEMQQQKIGEGLVCVSVEVANALNNGQQVKVPLFYTGINSMIHNFLSIPKLVTAIMTSNYAQIIARRCRLKVLERINYRGFRYGDVSFRKRIGKEHRDFTVVAKKIKN
ncbi:uncharacterized protein LOC143262195 [Megalopta genalis]|uniref:uncharacterized protein LOC143262195 n=1 Tax=Megalopta genalis TaxID=115081 RepID=UPI003FD31F80